MTTSAGSHDARAAHSRDGEHRFPGTAVVRSLVLGAAVFTLAAIAGAVLSGAAPAGPGITQTEPVATVSSSDGGATSPAAVDPRDPLYAYSMIVTGVGALAISIAGSAMVVRRRRHW
jgi:hypothetical protein